jgi:hypothetical protein
MATLTDKMEVLRVLYTKPVTTTESGLPRTLHKNSSRESKENTKRCVDCFSQKAYGKKRIVALMCAYPQKASTQKFSGVIKSILNFSSQ